MSTTQIIFTKPRINYMIGQDNLFHPHRSIKKIILVRNFLQWKR